jgi:hypothetical protein
VQNLLWSNAGFDTLRKVDNLSKYTERWDPTVIPLHSGASYTPNLDLVSFKPVSADAIGKYRSIIDYHNLYKSGELTPSAVVEALLPLIRRDIDSPTKHSTALIDCHYDVIIEAAKASTLRYKAGKPLSSELPIMPL